MPRRYRVPFDNVAVTAAQDLVTIFGATGKMCRIIEVAVCASDTALPTSQMLDLRCRYLPATVTTGSGGAAGVITPTDPGDAAASFTARTNDTSKATTNATATVRLERACHIYAGLDYMFPDPPPVGPTDAFVFELLSTVSGTVHLSGGLLVEEIGGAA